MPFFAVDSVVVFDLFTDERELLFVLTSFIVDCDCRLFRAFRHFEQYHRHLGSLISAVLTGGLWHF